MRWKAKKIIGMVVSGTPKTEYRRNDGTKSEKCRLYIQSLTSDGDIVEELAVTCSGELANYFYYRGMVEIEYVQRVHSPKPNIFINEAYALNIRVV